MKRREAREIAVQMMYGLHFEDIPEDQLSFDDLLDKKFNEAISVSEITFTLEEKQFCIDLVKQTYDHLNEIDTLIKQFSKKWSFDRINVLEKCVLRLAVMEIEYTDIPDKVAINEAVELTEDFSGQRSKKFVNGILDAVMHRNKEK